MKEVIVKHRGICENIHTIKFSEPVGGDHSEMILEFINVYGSGVNFQKTEKGFKIVYNGDDEIKSFLSSISHFQKYLRCYSKDNDTQNGVELIGF